MMTESDLFERTFALADVLAVARLKKTTLDQWFFKGYLELEKPAAPHQPRSFTARDVVLIAAMVELSQLGFAPSRTLGNFAELIRSAARFWHDQERKQVYGPPERLNSRSLHRYLIIYPDPDRGGRLNWFQAKEASEGATYVARIVFDCFALAERVVNALEKITLNEPDQASAEPKRVGRDPRGGRGAR